jgi:hypothetical protein
MVPSVRGLETRYQTLLSINNKLHLYKNVVGILTIPMIGSIFLPISLSNNLPTNPLIILIGPFAVMILQIALVMRSNKYVMKKGDLTFFRLYDAYHKLRTYRDAKTIEIPKENARTSIILLANHVATWAASVPESILKLPNTISKNLKEKLLPLINDKEIDTISSFIDITLFNAIFQMPENGPTLETLERINNGLESLPSSKELLKVKKKRRIGTKNLKLSFIIGGIVVYVLGWVYVQSSQPAEIVQIFLNNSVIAFGVIGLISFIIYMMGRRKTEITFTS